jgi:hypothetical protein
VTPATDVDPRRNRRSQSPEGPGQPDDKHAGKTASSHEPIVRMLTAPDGRLENLIVRAL